MCSGCGDKPACEEGFSSLKADLDAGRVKNGAKRSRRLGRDYQLVGQTIDFIGAGFRHANRLCYLCIPRYMLLGHPPWLVRLHTTTTPYTIALSSVAALPADLPQAHLPGSATVLRYSIRVPTGTIPRRTETTLQEGVPNARCRPRLPCTS